MGKKFTVILPTHCPDEDYLVEFLKKHNIEVDNTNAPWDVVYTHESREVLVELIELGWGDDLAIYLEGITEA